MNNTNHHHQSSHGNNNAVEGKENVQREQADRAMQSKRSLQERILQAENMRSSPTATPPLEAPFPPMPDAVDVASTETVNLTPFASNTSEPSSPIKSISGIAKKPRKSRASTNRCAKCRAKLGLMAVACKCKSTFCSMCRYPEEHSCTFDYRAEQQKHLQEDMVRVVASKVSGL